MTKNLKNTLEQITQKIKDNSIEIILAASISGLLSIPALTMKSYELLTTTSINKYEIHVDSIIKSFGIPQYSAYFVGDTTGVTHNLGEMQFKLYKDYEIQVRTYGFLGEKSIENIKEIN
jgi:hypothetical protein